VHGGEGGGTPFPRVGEFQQQAAGCGYAGTGSADADLRNGEVCGRRKDNVAEGLADGRWQGGSGDGGCSRQGGHVAGRIGQSSKSFYNGTDRFGSKLKLLYHEAPLINGITKY